MEMVVTNSYKLVHTYIGMLAYVYDLRTRMEPHKHLQTYMFQEANRLQTLSGSAALAAPQCQACSESVNWWKDLAESLIPHRLMPVEPISSFPLILFILFISSPCCAALPRSCCTMCCHAMCC